MAEHTLLLGLDPNPGEEEAGSQALPGEVQKGQGGVEWCSLLPKARDFGSSLPALALLEGYNVASEPRPCLTSEESPNSLSPPLPTKPSPLKRFLLAKLLYQPH